MPGATSERRFFDVAIAGGGFAGQTLALVLAKQAPRGFRIALVDAEAPAAQSGRAQDARGLALSSATRSLLAVLRLWDALAPAAQPISSIEITDSPLEADLRSHFLGFDDELMGGEATAYIVEAGPLNRMLSAAVAEEEAIDVIAPNLVSDFTAGPFTVTAKLMQGGEIEARLLVAADGKRSKLRERAGIKCVGWSYPQVGIVTTVVHERPHRGRAIQHFLPAGPFAILPLTGNRSSIVWTEEKTRGDAIVAASEAEFVAELTKRFGHRLGKIELAGSRQSFPLDLQIARSFIADRLALIGDAAHVVHPLAGQGANLGLLDAAALADVLAEGLKAREDPGAIRLLRRYERWRRSENDLMSGAIDVFDRLLARGTGRLATFAQRGMPWVNRSTLAKRVFIERAMGLAGELPAAAR